MRVQVLFRDGRELAYDADAGAVEAYVSTMGHPSAATGASGTLGISYVIDWERLVLDDVLEVVTWYYETAPLGGPVQECAVAERPMIMLDEEAVEREAWRVRDAAMARLERPVAENEHEAQLRESEVRRPAQECLRRTVEVPHAAATPGRVVRLPFSMAPCGMEGAYMVLVDGHVGAVRLDKVGLPARDCLGRPIDENRGRWVVTAKVDALARMYLSEDEMARADVATRAAVAWARAWDANPGLIHDDLRRVLGMEPRDYWALAARADAREGVGERDDVHVFGGTRSGRLAEVGLAADGILVCAVGRLLEEKGERLGAYAGTPRDLHRKLEQWCDLGSELTWAVVHALPWNAVFNEVVAAMRRLAQAKGIDLAVPCDPGSSTVEAVVPVLAAKLAKASGHSRPLMDEVAIVLAREALGG